MVAQNRSPIDMQHILEVVKNVFSKEPLCIERVPEGVSTYVYRIVFPGEHFYLRILPEDGASFAPEVAVHAQLYSMHVKVPQVIHFEHLNELVQRSIMITSEIKGQPLSQSSTLSQREMEAILREAGNDLAHIQSILVEGFGWIRRDKSAVEQLQAEHDTYRDFVMEYWKADIAYLAAHVLSHAVVTSLEQILSKYDSWLDCTQGRLAHGDFDTTQIYQDNGRYTGIIDFGEIRGANREYDLGHFHMRDGEMLPLQLLPMLLSGYQEHTPSSLPGEQRILFTSLLINIRALARSLQKRPANRYTQHQLEVLEDDMKVLL